ncbi:peptidase A24A family [Janthinobacterium sp. Marseille]|nr:A24 family peptidase [Janthinobacterium sp. Marseille]ABR91807.1 peptidase A24A family [Janthinobacterium sp. Marseille]
MIAFLILLCIAIIAYDVLFRRVPNSLLLLALLVHTGYMIATGSGYAGLGVTQSLLAVVIALIVFVPLYALRVMGAGDVKFLAIVGALLGLKALFVACFIGSLVAGLHALMFYSAQMWLAMMPSGLHRLMQQVGGSSMYQRVLNARQGRKGIPYAAYLAIGVIFYLLMMWRGQ